MTEPSRAKSKASAKEASAVAKQREKQREGSLVEREVSALTVDLGRMIDAARTQLDHEANATLTSLYWQVGYRVRSDVLDSHRAASGQLVPALGRQLERRFGRGFGGRNLRRMVQFVNAFPDATMVAAMGRQLRWAHFRALIPMTDPLERQFYVDMCRAEGWSTRVLRHKIASKFYERTAASKQPEKLIRNERGALRTSDRLKPDPVFQDPYLLDFLGFEDAFGGGGLDCVLLREIERFLLDLDVGFAFVARRKRITVDGEDYEIGLLLFHRRLRRLVAVDLQLGDFKRAQSGRIAQVLQWLDRCERESGEDPALAFILCVGRKRETVEYLTLDPSRTKVAEYLTELPPRDVLLRRFQEALAVAWARIDHREVPACFDE